MNNNTFVCGLQIVLAFLYAMVYPIQRYAWSALGATMTLTNILSSGPVSTKKGR
jgi:hypothetical protein